MYLSFYFSKKNSSTGFCYYYWLLFFYAFVLTSSSLISHRIHFRVAKCWLMSHSFIPILQLPLLGGQQEKSHQKLILTRSDCLHVLLHSLPRPASASSPLWSQALPFERRCFQGCILLPHSMMGIRLVEIVVNVKIDGYFLTNLQSQFTHNNSVL